MKRSPIVRFITWGMAFLLASNFAISQPRTFTVNSTADTPDAVLDGNCNDGTGNCTLRAAIMEANFNLNAHDVIQFSIPGTGPHTITLVNDLPALLDDSGVTIDGLTEPGSTAGITPPSTATLMIELNGSVAIPIPPAVIVHGIYVLSDSNDIRGLVRPLATNRVASGQTIELDGRDLRNGVYLVKIWNGEDYHFEKLIIQH